MTWVAAAAAVGSAAIGYMGSQQAANAQSSAAKKNRQLAQQQYNNSLTMLEPNRYMGYQAGADLSSLYGWGTSGYTPLSQLQYGGGTGGSLNVPGAGATEGGGALNPNNTLGDSWGNVDPLGSAMNSMTFGAGGLIGGGTKEVLGATIDPKTGMVDVAGGHAGKDATLTNYLQTGVWSGKGEGKRVENIKSAVDQLRASGWTYDAATGKGAFPGAIEATPAGEPGNMSRFFTSPDYQYTFDQAIKGNDRSAAARGGALSGNAITANTTTAANLGAGQYQNYVNNLFRAMGYGQNATTGSVDAGNTYVNNQSANNTAAGDARASGIANQYGAIAGGLNSLGSIYGNYLGSKTPSTSYSQYGPYASGYSTPNSMKIPEAGSNYSSWWY